MQENKKQKLSKLVGTYFRNGLKSNLDLTALADTKAGILISINGFILTVTVTASGFAVHNPIMNYAFMSIILTSLVSIIFAVLAVRPRSKEKLVKKEHLEGYNSLLYYQDMAEMEPTEYMARMKKSLLDTEESSEEMIKHLHILGAEIKKKYFWLKQAYTFFSIGLIVSASLVIYGLMYVEQTPFYNLSKGNVIYKADKFYNIFEPSGVTTLPNGKVLVVEDENMNSLKILDVSESGDLVEVGKLHMTKDIKKEFKKNIEDLEAITSYGNRVYAITSHTPTKDGRVKTSRNKLASFIYTNESIQELDIYGSLKEDLYENFPELFKTSIFTIDVLNIEGLCFDEESKTLMIGFRTPMKDNKAIIIGITNPEEVMANLEKPKFTQATFLNLGGLGIRDFTYDSLKKGFWIIAGSSSDRNDSFKLWFWDKANSKLSIIKNQPDIGFGEGITIVNRDGKNPALFIVEDNGQKPNKSADYILINKATL